ncbi:DNA-3-methyladenine glycosylase II [Propionibacterium ruminifibrarum]|uniref:Putative 3-methyladenine DNA glycosylase n=1 Tax=Propionibacterium ruminifibrarum TaxID=1962131 RepID=A0A375I5N2_9ACTN|nr:DNA-3-methyladenine glycosylase II [Propionibacterium ruminifibrarum]
MHTGAVIDLSGRADEIAPGLLGAVIRRGEVAVRLTEVEAYLGTDDPASHAYRGERGRAAVMFGAPGTVYVYVSYGIHRAGNIVCSPAGQASAVLMRAGEVVAGADRARERRRLAPDRPDTQLARGPGNLGRALGLDLADNGLPLGGRDDLFELIEPGPGRGRVLVGPRIGITRAADAPLRFWLADEPTVSARRRGTPWRP